MTGYLKFLIPGAGVVVVGGGLLMTKYNEGMRLAQQDGVQSATWLSEWVLIVVLLFTVILVLGKLQS